MHELNQLNQWHSLPLSLFIFFFKMSVKSDVIQPIEKSVVNQICSGQVILSLATAVKELVENSLDANATSIQIRLKEYGTEIVEIADNGHGVEEKNFQALTLKHYTSKISTFSDVSTVETFGFRGEALSSLCSLSNVTIITRHEDSLSGTKLKFDVNGVIVSSSKIARQIGTTVILENIFYTLPVRHKEFLRNVKKEFVKMCNTLYAYGLLSKGISIVCKNEISNRKVAVMATKGESLKANIGQIFGTKQAQNLIDVTKCELQDITTEESNVEDVMNVMTFDEITLEGVISSCAHGCGRLSTDRQFYYINSRPIDNPKVVKLVNDIYHQYNPHQYPFIVLNIKIDMNNIDVNVTPDKRVIFLKNENLIFTIIKASLHKILRNIPAIINYSNIGLNACKESVDTSLNKYKNDSNGSPLEKLVYFGPEPTPENKDKKLENKSLCTREMRRTFFKSFSRFPDNKNVEKVDEFNSNELHKPKESKFTGTNIPKKKINSSINKSFPNEDCKALKKLTECTSILENSNSNVMIQSEISSPPQIVNEEEKIFSSYKRKDFNFTEEQSHNKYLNTDTQNQAIKRLKTDEGIAECFKRNRKTIMLDCNLVAIRQCAMKSKTVGSENKSCLQRIRFYSQINPQQNESAENELKKELNKESFKIMDIIGQFNLGFIITKMGPDVFIIDQHATDEKYNFESLQRDTKLLTQKLVIPQNLNLTVEKEELFLQHSDIIRRNGFDFTYDNSESPTNRIKLTSVPLSKSWIFGKEDIDELLFMLENAPDGSMCRPSRIRDMFASRACRKSVMIGTPLSHFEMRRLVDHMGELEQPWNCPHGRPTIRHLVNLNLVRMNET